MMVSSKSHMNTRSNWLSEAGGEGFCLLPLPLELRDPATKEERSFKGYQLSRIVLANNSIIEAESSQELCCSVRYLLEELIPIRDRLSDPNTASLLTIGH